MVKHVNVCGIISCLGTVVAVALAIVILIKVNQKSESFRVYKTRAKSPLYAQHYGNDGTRYGGGDSDMSHVRPLKSP